MPRYKQRISSLMPEYPPPYSRHETERVLKPEDLLSPAHIIPEVQATGGVTSRCRLSFCCVGTAFVILICIFFVSALFPYPMHASCTVTWSQGVCLSWGWLMFALLAWFWKFNEPCTFVMQRLRCQILKWSTCHGCGRRGTRCLYSLSDSRLDDDLTIKATHVTPNIRLIDGIKMTFEKTINNSCTAVAKSESNQWFVMFDYGSNYCNLHNLVVGAGLDSDRGFLELTNNAICTQLNMASCD